MTKSKLHVPNCSDNCKAWHNPNQAAALLGTSRGTVYYLMRVGKLKFKDTDIGKRISHRAIDDFINLKSLTILNTIDHA
jgi:hypothetical protein